MTVQKVIDDTIKGYKSDNFYVTLMALSFVCVTFFELIYLDRW